MLPIAHRQAQDDSPSIPLHPGIFLLLNLFFLIFIKILYQLKDLQK
jgi:hypothetical protein